MQRLSKKDVQRMMLEAGSVITPTLSRYFKYVFVGLAMKDRIEQAKRKANIYW